MITVTITRSKTIWMISQLYMNAKYTIVMPKIKPHITAPMNKLRNNLPAFKVTPQLAHIILSGFNLRKNRIKDIG
jgi:hypothetical protein